MVSCLGELDRSYNNRCKLVSHADLKALNEDWNSTKAPGQVIDIQH